MDIPVVPVTWITSTCTCGAALGWLPGQILATCGHCGTDIMWDGGAR